MTARPSPESLTVTLLEDLMLAREACVQVAMMLQKRTSPVGRETDEGVLANLGISFYGGCDTIVNGPPGNRARRGLVAKVADEQRTRKGLVDLSDGLLAEIQAGVPLLGVILRTVLPARLEGSDHVRLRFEGNLDAARIEIALAATRLCTKYVPIVRAILDGRTLAALPERDPGAAASPPTGT